MTAPRSIDNSISERAKVLAYLRDSHAKVLHAQRQMLDLALECDRHKLWRKAGYPSLAAFVNAESNNIDDGQKWERAVRLVVECGANPNDVVVRMQNWDF